MKKYFFIAIIFFSMLLTNVWADGVEVNLIEGNTVIPVLNNNVRMVSEEVKMFEKIETRKIPHRLIPFITKEVKISKGMKIVANFLFENLTDSPVTMKMGFPLSRGENPPDFKAWSQGQPVKVDQRQMGGKGEIVLKDSGGFVLEMYVWDISFSAREKKTVSVEYTGQWGSPVRGNTQSYFMYIVKTGALWSGNIERADFYMKLPKYVMSLLSDKRYRFKLNIKPEGYVLKDDQLEWFFRNWKPTEDISVSVDEEPPAEQEAIQHISQYFKDKIYEGNMRHYAERDIEIWNESSPMDFPIMQRFYVKALRNEIYARHGRIFTTPEMKQIFESSPWYKPRKDFKESDLNEIEKKNVEFIFEYEKKMGWK